MPILPSPDEIEISVFGPGFGECIVVHFGEGDWAIIDSHLDPITKQPIALDYLAKLGVNVSSQVKLILVTHWHDDHIRGIAQIVEKCPAARFVCSNAYKRREYLEIFVASSAMETVDRKAGGSELGKVLKHIQKRSKSLFSPVPDQWVSEGTLVYANNLSVQAIAISPSSLSCASSISQISELIPVKESVGVRFPSTGPNDHSIALVISAGGESYLLGGDLEHSSDPGMGWNAAVNSPVRPQTKSSLFKVAHHGSSGADAKIIWEHLLQPNPIAIVTPYSRLSVPIPNAADILRIKQNSGNAYCTAVPATLPPSKSGMVNKEMSRRAKNRRVLQQRGHVRFRVAMSLGAKPTIDLFGQAKEI